MNVLKKFAGPAAGAAAGAAMMVSGGAAHQDEPKNHTPIEQEQSADPLQQFAQAIASTEDDEPRCTYQERKLNECLTRVRLEDCSVVIYNSCE